LLFSQFADWNAEEEQQGREDPEEQLQQLPVFHENDSLQFYKDERDQESNDQSEDQQEGVGAGNGHCPKQERERGQQLSERYEEIPRGHERDNWKGVREEE
jgi:hypothetical protein